MTKFVSCICVFFWQTPARRGPAITHLVLQPRDRGRHPWISAFGGWPRCPGPDIHQRAVSVSCGEHGNMAREASETACQTREVDEYLDNCRSSMIDHSRYPRSTSKQHWMFLNVTLKYLTLRFTQRGHASQGLRQCWWALRKSRIPWPPNGLWSLLEMDAGWLVGIHGDTSLKTWLQYATANLL